MHVFWYVNSKIGLSLSQILLQNSNSYSLGNVQRLCYNFWYDCRSFLTNSATTAMFTSVRVDFGLSPLSSFSNSFLSSRDREYHLKTFDPFRASFPQTLCTNTSVSVADRPALKQNLMATLCSIPASMTCKETDFTWQVITRALSKITKYTPCVNGCWFKVLS